MAISKTEGHCFCLRSLTFKLSAETLRQTLQLAGGSMAVFTSTLVRGFILASVFTSLASGHPCDRPAPACGECTTPASPAPAPCPEKCETCCTTTDGCGYRAFKTVAWTSQVKGLRYKSAPEAVEEYDLVLTTCEIPQRFIAEVCDETKGLYAPDHKQVKLLLDQKAFDGVPNTMHVNQCTSVFALDACDGRDCQRDGRRFKYEVDLGSGKMEFVRRGWLEKDHVVCLRNKTTKGAPVR